MRRRLLLALAALAGVSGFLLPALPSASQQQRGGALLQPSTGALAAGGARVSRSTKGLR